MYPRRNRDEENITNEQEQQQNLSAEMEAENIMNGAGNDAALVTNLLTSVSNEANNEALDDDSMAHYKQQHLNRYESKKKKNKGMSENEPLGGQAAEKGLNLINKLAEDDPDFRIKNEDDINQAPGAEINIGKAKSSKKAGAPKAGKAKKPGKDLAGIEEFLDEVKDEDIAHVGEDMEPVKGLNFQAQTLPPRNNKPSGAKRFLSRLTYYSGKTVGTLVRLISGLASFPYAIGRLIQLGLRRKENKNAAQKRDRNAVPGWDGKQFEETVKNDKELDIDFRRVPAVWSYPTADKAVDSSGNPRPPVLSVYVDQPNEKRDQTMTRGSSSGHTGIGIEYSRYSKTTGRWERYNLRYGFWMAGGLSTVSAGAMVGVRQANVPGQLIDEKGENYTISRSYPATAKQVNAVMKASLPYADKGYNSYTRNCTSFAKAMLLDVAHIPAGEEIFARDELQINHSEERKGFAAQMAVTHLKIGMEGDLNKLITGDDMTYANFGQKRMSGEEYKNYRDSDGFFKRRPSKGDSPNAVAQNIKRLQGKDAGSIGRFVRLNPDYDQAGETISSDRQLLTIGGQLLKSTLQQITPPGSFENGEVPREYTDILKALDDLAAPVARYGKDRKPEEYSKDKLRQMRSGLSENLTLLNKLLFKYYKNDPRVQAEVIKLSSYINEINYYLDQGYEKRKDDDEKAEGDLGDIRKDLTKNEYQIKFANENKTYYFTPSMYEAYLQIYKTRKEFVKNYSKFITLYQKGRNGGRLSKDEQKQLQKYERIENLAYEFSQSHRYMLEKDSYSQQDTDYAFQLGNKEKDGAFSDEMTQKNLFASDIYKSLFFEKIFAGQKERITQAVTEGKKDGYSLSKWLEEDMAECVSSRKDEMTKIIRSLANNLKDNGKIVKNPTQYQIQTQLHFAIQENWLSQLFRGSEEQDIRKKVDGAWGSVSTTWGKLYSAFSPIIDQIIKEMPKPKDEVEEED